MKLLKNLILYFLRLSLSIILNLFDDLKHKFDKYAKNTKKSLRVQILIISVLLSHQSSMPKPMHMHICACQCVDMYSLVKCLDTSKGGHM